MSRALVIVRDDEDRKRAALWSSKAPLGCRIEFKASKRSLPQNSRLWAMLTDVSEQFRWHGIRLTPDKWKLIFLDALKREIQIVPNLDGTGFVNIGQSSSDLSKEEMGDLMEVIAAFGAREGVVFHEDGV